MNMLQHTYHKAFMKHPKGYLASIFHPVLAHGVSEENFITISLSKRLWASQKKILNAFHIGSVGTRQKCATKKTSHFTRGTL